MLCGSSIKGRTYLPTWPALSLTLFVVGTGAFAQTATVDGSRNPALIPDEIAQQVVMLSFSSKTGDADVSKRRAQAFIKSLRLSSSDEQSLSQAAERYRESFTASNQDLAKSSVAARYDSLIQLSRTSIAELSTQLSPDSAKLFRDYVLAAKRRIKLFPIPNMSHASLRDRLFDSIFSWISPTVHAQMSPSGSIYTADAGGSDPNAAEGSSGAGLWVYSATYAGGCQCHQVSMSSIVITPTGYSGWTSANNTLPNEDAELQYFYPISVNDLAEGDGEFQVRTNHSAFCPISNQQFINDFTYVINAMNRITAYYRYTGNQNAGRHVYTRCSPVGSVCDNCDIQFGVGVWQFGLFDGAALHIEGTGANICLMRAIRQESACRYPDPRPGTGFWAADRLRKSPRTPETKNLPKRRAGLMRAKESGE